MKTFLKLFACALVLAVKTAFATGAVGVDPVQTGTLNFTAGTTVYITNSFPYAYTTPPIVTFTAVTTNSLPITNIFVTTTNFAVSANTTNSQISWVASVGFPRVQTGTNAIQGSLLLTNTFTTPFAFNPVVQMTYSSTNQIVGTPAISSVSTTNFVIQFGNTNQVIYWGALGICATPGSYNPSSPAITF